MHRRIAASVAVLGTLALVSGCARGIVDEEQGSITTDVPPPSTAEPVPPRRVSADAPARPAATPRASYDDPAGDVATPGAADIRRVSVSQDADFMLEVVVELSGSGDVDLVIDSDLKQDTGFEGFDVRVAGSAASNTVQVWFSEGGVWTAQDPPTFTSSFGEGKLVMRIHRAYLGLGGSRGPIGLAVGTQQDMAPDNALTERYVFRPLE